MTGRSTLRWLSCFVGVVVVAFVFAAIFCSDTSRAMHGWNTGRNTAEQRGWGGNPCGDYRYLADPCAVWWPSYHGSGYFQTTGLTPEYPLEMDWNATSIYFAIRGSWNTQEYRRPLDVYSLFSFNGQGRHTWVTNGHVDGNGNYYFFRGRYDGGGPTYQWINGERWGEAGVRWDEHDQLDVGVDVRGVGTPGGGPVKITLGAKSCMALWRNGAAYTYSGASINCGTDNITLWVRRGGFPRGWNIQGENYVYNRSEDRSYANYNNSNAYGTSRPYAQGHAEGQPTVLPGKRAEFIANVRNIRYSNFQHVDSDIQVVVESAYFKNFNDVVNCAGKDWRHCGGSDNGHRALITYGAVGDRYGNKCRAVPGNLVQRPDQLVNWSGREDDDCMRVLVPNDNSRIGSYICTQTWWSWPNSTRGGWTTSEPACARVASDFNLVPGVGPANGSTAIGAMEKGNATTLDSTIYNTGGRRESGANSDADVFTFAFTGSTAAMSDSQLGDMLKGVFNRSNGDRYYAETNYSANMNTCAWLNAQAQLAGKISDCTPTNARSSSFDSTEVIDTSALDAARYTVGDVVCRVATVNRYNWNTTSDALKRRVSYPRCYRISKKPMVQIWGGDVRVGSSNLSNVLSIPKYKSGIYTGGARTLNIGNSPHSIGSWGEYGLFAPEISSYGRSNVVSASGGALSGMGTTSRLGTVSGDQLNGLTFANSKAIYGQWGTIGAQNTVKSSYFGSQQSLSGENISLNGLNGSYKLSSSRSIVTLSGGAIGVGKSVIIDAGNKTVVIDNDIRYDSSNFSNASQLPQAIIYARNIIIKDNVTNVDAWLIATGTNNGVGGVISTCEVDESGIRSALTRTDYTSGLKSTVCDKPLQINGTVSARVLQLRRTHGADGTTGNENGYTTPAEVINARMDTYIWAYNRASMNSSISTDVTTELPPRY